MRLARRVHWYAGCADLHGHHLRLGRCALRSTIPPEHAGNVVEPVVARAGVLPSDAPVQLSFGALLKMDDGLRQSSGERAGRGEPGDWAGVGALLRAPTARVVVHGAWVRAGAQCACRGRRNGRRLRRAVSPAEVCRAVTGGSM